VLPRVARLAHSTPPGLTMSMTLSFPKANAMALGGVATGSMKASEAEMVHGTMR